MYMEPSWFLPFLRFCIGKQTYFPTLLDLFTSTHRLFPARRSCAVKFGLAGLVWPSDQDDMAKTANYYQEGNIEEKNNGYIVFE
jgi:hypothetical protein